MAKELKDTKTEANLQTAFAGESQARNKYTYYASKAKKEGVLLGHSPQMQNVTVKADEKLLGQIVRVRITKTAATTLDGILQK